MSATGEEWLVERMAATDKLICLRRLCDSCGQGLYVTIIDEVLAALSDEGLTALAAATGTAKTAKQAECEASQSGAAKTAQRPTSSTQSGVR